MQTTQSSSTTYMIDTLALHITKWMDFSIAGIKQIIIFSYKGSWKSSIRDGNVLCEGGCEGSKWEFAQSTWKSQFDDRKHGASLVEATGFRFSLSLLAAPSATFRFSPPKIYFQTATTLQSTSVCASIVYCNYFCVMPLKTKVGSTNAATSRRCYRLVNTFM